MSNPQMECTRVTSIISGISLLFGGPLGAMCGRFRLGFKGFGSHAQSRFILLCFPKQNDALSGGLVRLVPERFCLSFKGFGSRALIGSSEVAKRFKNQAKVVNFGDHGSNNSRQVAVGRPLTILRSPELIVLLGF